MRAATNRLRTDTVSRNDPLRSVRGATNDFRGKGAVNAKSGDRMMGEAVDGRSMTSNPGRREDSLDGVSRVTRC